MMRGSFEGLICFPRTIWTTSATREIYNLHLTDPSRLGQTTSCRSGPSFFSVVSSSTTQMVLLRGRVGKIYLRSCEISGGAADLQAEHRNKAIARCITRNALMAFKSRVRHMMEICAHKADSVFPHRPNPRHIVSHASVFQILSPAYKADCTAAPIKRSR